MITVYTLTYNEELLIQFMINHYRSRFPNCHIVVYDNNSTDRTVEIAKANNCEVRGYPANNQLDDGLHMRIKNNCWKNAATDWVLMCDLDEMLDITEEQLKAEEAAGVSRIKTEAWTMVNMTDDCDLESLAKIDHGFRDAGYDKSLLFSKKHIQEINYDPGAHSCNPIGNVVDSTKVYQIRHYQYCNLNAFVRKRMETKKRLSETNKKYGWGLPQCSGTEQDKIADFTYRRQHSVKVPKP
jgi:glycosyltransferase involved in cell wall biosynthesis